MRSCDQVFEGDLIIINTALWYHSTELPSTRAATGGLCLSFARDFYLGGASAAADEEVDMANLQDSWATSDVPKGTVIVTDKEQEDWEATLGSFNSDGIPNCELRTTKKGVNKVVAMRDINEGESLILKR